MNKRIWIIGGVATLGFVSMKWAANRQNQKQQEKKNALYESIIIEARFKNGRMRELIESDDFWEKYRTMVQFNNIIAQNYGS